MNRLLRALPIAATLVVLTCCAPVEGQDRRGAEPAEEFRAAWVATVNNIDFPSKKGLRPAQLRAELDAIVARAVALKLNALIFQVRAAADAFYASPLEPWSEWLTGVQGKAPGEGLDPLRYLIDRCHRSGLQLHAWFNPFRCWHKAGTSRPHPRHITQRAPQLTHHYGAYQWMDPGHPTAHTWTLAVIQDVVRRYDIDGVHIDDYFYPYPENGKPFPDDASWSDYRANGGKLRRDDWRRDNINRFVRRLYEMVHDEKPWLMVGISPFGIARPGVPAGIQAGLDQYGQLYADVPKWLSEGWCDYLAPQLYWPIDQQPQAFAKLLRYWHEQNTAGRAIWPGLYTSRIREGGSNVRGGELHDEIQLTRRAGQGMPGHIHFSFKALRGDHALTARQLRQRSYLDVASVPRLPWLQRRPR
ncbi:MAG: family 10 glycosylhydrolase [Planctomycetota bacterium]|nr:family 10 glycosylhydrolase [Planctomycetota bacterium]